MKTVFLFFISISLLLNPIETITFADVTDCGGEFLGNIPENSLGSGAFGQVYCFEQGKVVKKIRYNDVKDLGKIIKEINILMILEEIEKAGKMNKATAYVLDKCKTSGSDTDSGIIYLTLEACCKTLIPKWISKYTEEFAGDNKKFSKYAIGEIIKIVNILLELHENNIYHLDLHTENFMYCRESLKIIDFGVGEIFEQQDVYTKDMIERKENYGFGTLLLQALAFVESGLIPDIKDELENLGNLVLKENKVLDQPVVLPLQNIALQLQNMLNSIQEDLRI